LEAKKTAKSEIPKNINCLRKIEYVEPDCCKEYTLEAESTMTIPRADRKVMAPIIK
jgi:hypothetical protein